MKKSEIRMTNVETKPNAQNPKRPELAFHARETAGAVGQAVSLSYTLGSPTQLSAGLLFEGAEARLPVAVGQLMEKHLCFSCAARLLQAHRPVVEDLGIGRLGIEGGGIGVVGQLPIAPAAKLLRQTQPRRRLIGTARNGCRQIIPAQLRGANGLKNL